MSQGIASPFKFALRLFLVLLSIEACLTFGPWSSARAQFDVGVGVRSGGGDRIRDDRGSERDRNIGVGIGIGIEVGRTIEQNSSKGPPPEKKYGRKDGNDKKKKEGDGKVAKPDDKKTDDKKPDDKKDDKKPAQVATSIDDCLLIIEYPPGQIAAPDGATNTDLKGSAAALKASLKGSTAEQTITKDNKIGDALKKLTAGGKCCKRILIFGHGYEDGSLTVPYPTYEGGEGDKAYHVAGDGLKQGPGQDAFAAFAKDIKDALCKDPKSGKPAKDSEVRIHACWSANNVSQDHSIGEELSKKGITTWGYQDVVKFPYTAPEGDDSKREYSPPEPKQAGEYKKLDAVQPKGK